MNQRSPECGVELDRDLNASVNILRRGFVHLTGGRDGASRTYACGEGEKPSLKQEFPSVSSGWDNLYQKLCYTGRRGSQYTKRRTYESPFDRR